MIMLLSAKIKHDFNTHDVDYLYNKMLDMFLASNMSKHVLLEYAYYNGYTHDERDDVSLEFSKPRHDQTRFIHCAVRSAYRLINHLFMSHRTRYAPSDP